MATTGRTLIRYGTGPGGYGAYRRRPVSVERRGLKVGGVGLRGLGLGGLGLCALGGTPAARGRPYAVGEPAGGDEEAGVADHAVVGPYGESLDVPGAQEGLEGVGLGERTVLAQGLDDAGQ